MSDSRYFQKYKAQDIENELVVLEKKPKSAKQKKICMKRVVANMTMGNNEMVVLFPQVVRLYGTDDVELKRMCGEYLSHYSFVSQDHVSGQEDVFFRDLTSTSPVVRVLALKLVVGFPACQKAVVPYVRLFLKDTDPYIRRSAVFSVGKLFEMEPELAELSGLVEGLHKMLLDSSSSVVGAALTVLEYIVEHSSIKLAIDVENVDNLLALLPKCSEFFQAYILSSFLSYVPQTNGDSVRLVDRILPYLQHSNTAVVMNALKVIFYVSNYIKAPQDVISSLPKRLGNSLVSLLTKPGEIQFLVLRNVILLLLSKPQLVKLDVTMFFCRYDDQIYVKDTKLEIIYLLANSSNLKTVLRELEEYATEIDQQMARKSIRAIGNLAIKLDDAAEPCTEVLLGLSSSGIPFIVQETVIVIKNILRKYPRRFESSIDTFVGFTDLIQEPEAKCSFLWMVGTYSDLIPNALDLLKDYAFDTKQDPLEVQLTLLTAVVKYYLRNPHKGELLLLSLLKTVTQSENPDLRDRGYFYWRLLSSQKSFPQSGLDIVLTELPEISSDQDKLDPKILEELELNIGTLASIYLKPVNLVFRLARQKSLTKSPALQSEYNKSIKSPNPNDGPALPEKILKINIKSNIGTIKSPRMASHSLEFQTIDESVLDNENEVDYNPKSVFDKQRFLTKKKSKELLGFVNKSSENEIEPSRLNESSQSFSPKLDILKRRMTFTKRKSIISPKPANRNFTS